MKSSFFNLFIPLRNRDYLLYNTLNKVKLIVDRELKDIIEKSSFENLSNEDHSKLGEWGFIVDDALDERRIYGIKHNRAKYTADVSGFLVFPTFLCNLSCPYCYEKGAFKPEEKSMDENTAARTINFIKNITRDNQSRAIILGLYGGEPLLEHKICLDIAKDIYNWAREEGISYYCALTTNGTLLSENIYIELGPFLSSIHFTIDGSRERNNRFRFYKDSMGTYDDVMRAISLASGGQHHLTIRIHIEERNYEEEIRSIIKDLEKIGLKERDNTHLYFMHIMPPNSCMEYSDIHRFILKSSEYWNSAKKLGWNGKLDIDEGEEHSILQHSSLTCGFIKKGHYVIDPSADLYLCPSVAGLKEYSVGSINAYGKPVWNHSYYELITRNPVYVDECRDCAFLPMCNGGCPINVYNNCGTYHGFSCGNQRDVQELILQSYFRYKYPEKFQGG